MAASEKLFISGEVQKNDHIVVLDDGETYGGIKGATVRRNGEEFDIERLLDFYCKNLIFVVAQNITSDEWDDVVIPQPTGGHISNT